MKTTIKEFSEQIQENSSQENITQQQKSSIKEIDDQKEAFLIQFYSISICQYFGILVVFGIFQVPEFSNLLFFKGYKDWQESNFTYENYKNKFNHLEKSYDYLDWKNEQLSQHFEFEFRWFYITIVIIFSIMTLGISVLDRKHKQFAKHGQKLFYFQTSFIGVILGGFATEFRNTCKYSNKFYFIIWTFVLLIINAITMIILVKIKKLYYYENIRKTIVYFFLPLNIFLTIGQAGLTQDLLIFQSIIIYCLYYFNQFNHSIQTANGDNYIYSIKKWINGLRQYDNQEDQVAKSQLQQRYVILEKRIVLLILLLIGILLLLTICLIIEDKLYSSLLIATVLQNISLILEIQVCQIDPEQDNIYVAVCSMYLDCFIIFKNFINSFSDLLK